MAKIVKADQIDEASANRMAALRLSELTAEVNEVVLDARQQAARILQSARTEARAVELEAEEKARAEGFERGRAEGFAAGERQAHEQVRDELEAEVTKIAGLAQTIVDRLASQGGGPGDSAGSEMLNLAIRLAERIVGRVATVDIAAAEQNLAKALELAVASRQVTVLVNPGQLADLRNRCGKLVTVLAGSSQVELVGDHSIAPGGVKILTGGGEIDATIETQLANVAEALLGPSAASERLGQYQTVDKNMASKPTHATV